MAAKQDELALQQLFRKMEERAAIIPPPPPLWDPKDYGVPEFVRVDYRLFPELKVSDDYVKAESRYWDGGLRDNLLAKYNKGKWVGITPTMEVITDSLEDVKQQLGAENLNKGAYIVCLGREAADERSVFPVGTVI